MVACNCNRAEHRRAQARPDHDHTMRAQQRHRLVRQHLRQGRALFRAADDDVGYAEFLADVEHRHTLRDEGGIVIHRPHRRLHQAERDHRRGMAVRDRHRVRPCLENLAVQVALEKGIAPAQIARHAVEIEFHDVVGSDQGRRERARHQEAPGMVRMPHGDVAGGVEHALIGKDAACRGEILQHDTLDRTAGLWRGAGHRSAARRSRRGFLFAQTLRHPLHDHVPGDELRVLGNLHVVHGEVNRHVGESLGLAA
jgi:hypothetical protein